jgi:hypothetical protein
VVCRWRSAVRDERWNGCCKKVKQIGRCGFICLWCYQFSLRVSPCLHYLAVTCHALSRLVTLSCQFSQMKPQGCWRNSTWEWFAFLDWKVLTVLTVVPLFPESQHLKETETAWRSNQTNHGFYSTKEGKTVLLHNILSKFGSEFSHATTNDYECEVLSGRVHWCLSRWFKGVLANETCTVPNIWNFYT